MQVVKANGRIRDNSQNCLKMIWTYWKDEQRKNGKKWWLPEEKELGKEENHEKDGLLSSKKLEQ
jgi:hypothetical protein